MSEFFDAPAPRRISRWPPLCFSQFRKPPQRKKPLAIHTTPNHKSPARDPRRQSLLYILVHGMKRPVSARKDYVMKISARNALEGVIKNIHKGSTTAHVEIELKGGQIVTASITNESVDELKLATGQSAFAVVKASDVMVAVK
jgi:molybdopterin-binding protein